MALFDPHHPWVFAFGVLGNIVSVLVCLAPLPTFIRIYRKKSTMGYESLPYVVALFSAMLWIYYALLKDAVLLISINSLGCIIETIYIFIYMLYASKQARKNTTKLVALLNVGTFCAIFVLTNFCLQNESVRIMVVGWICVAFSVCVFAAPLSIVFQVVRTRSAEFLPFTLSFALTLNAVMWFSYGLLQRDICVAVPNVLGFFLGLLQMLLYGIYRNPKPLEDVVEKKVPEHVINIVMLGNSEVHPVDSQTSSNCDVTSTIDLDEEKKDEEVDRIHMRSNSTPDPDEEKKDEEIDRIDHTRLEDHNMASHSLAALADEPCGRQAHVNIEQLDSPLFIACPTA